VPFPAGRDASPRLPPPSLFLSASPLVRRLPVKLWPCLCLSVLPVPCSDRKSPFLVPSLQSRPIGAPGACQDLAVGGRVAREHGSLKAMRTSGPDALCRPNLTGEDAEILSHAGRGEALLKHKKLQPSWAVRLSSCPATIRRVSKNERVFHNLAVTTTGKNLPEESIGFRGG